MNKLSELLHQRDIALASNRLKTLLASVGELTFQGFVADSEEPIALGRLWRAIARYDAVPSSKIERDSLKADVSKWLRDCLANVNINGGCYISIGSFGDLPWTRVSVDPNGDWLLALWEQLNYHDMMIMSSNKDVILAFIEEEHGFEAYIKNVCCKTEIKIGE